MWISKKYHEELLNASEELVNQLAEANEMIELLRNPPKNDKEYTIKTISGEVVFIIGSRCESDMMYSLTRAYNKDGAIIFSAKSDNIEYIKTKMVNK